MYDLRDIQQPLYETQTRRRAKLFSEKIVLSEGFSERHGSHRHNDERNARNTK